MLCCVVAGTLLAAGYRIRIWFTRRGAGPTRLFAPPARRPGPGEVVPDSPVPVVLRISRRPLILRWAAAGMVTYPPGIAVLLALGWATASGGGSVWAVRTAALAAAAVTVLWSARHGVAGALEPPGSLREHLGCALVGIGLVWFVVGVIDMHALNLFHLNPEPADAMTDHAHSHVTTPDHRMSAPRDWVFHGVGPLGVMLGWSSLPVLPRVAETFSSAPEPATLHGSVPTVQRGRS